MFLPFAVLELASSTGWYSQASVLHRAIENLLSKEQPRIYAKLYLPYLRTEPRIQILVWAISVLHFGWGTLGKIILFKPEIQFLRQHSNILTVAQLDIKKCLGKTDSRCRLVCWWQRWCRDMGIATEDSSFYETNRIQNSHQNSQHSLRCQSSSEQPVKNILIHSLSSRLGRHQDAIV